MFHPRSCAMTSAFTKRPIILFLIVQAAIAGSVYAQSDQRSLAMQFDGIKHVGLMPNKDIGGYIVYLYTDKQHEENLAREAAKPDRDELFAEWRKRREEA